MGQNNKARNLNKEYDKMRLDPFEKEKLLQSIEHLRSFIEHLSVNESCSSCIYYGEKEGWCGAFNRAIPDHIIKTGCEKWEFDCIPF